MDKIIERVQKLFALAGNNPNEAEALAALEKAHAILAQHNLDIRDIEMSGTAPDSEDHRREKLDTETTMPERYFSWIWDGVGALHYCRVVYCRPNPSRYATRYTVIGRRINVLVATQLALYLCQTMRRCLSDDMKQTGRRDHAYKNAFLTGMARRLCSRMVDMKEAQANALVLWAGDEDTKNKEFLEQIFGDAVRTKKAVATRMDAAGLKAGRSAGDKVSFNQQVDRTAPRQAIG